MPLGNEDLVGQRFCEKLMRSPRASNGNRGGVFQPPVAMAKAKALKHRLIQFNGPRYISYLVFDVDRPAAALAWQDANLPRPTLIIENPRNTFAHYAYELAIGSKTNEAPIWPMRSTRQCVKRCNLIQTIVATSRRIRFIRTGELRRTIMPIRWQN